jgi:hypothetical protein
MQPSTNKDEKSNLKDVSDTKSNVQAQSANKDSNKNKKVDDKISKGRTATGSPADDIIINPIKELADKIGKVYDQVMSEADRSDTHQRDWGTTSLTNIYKNDTPGQVVNDKFRLQFKDPKGDKEAVSRSGNPDRKEIDLVPRNDPERDRKKDSTFYRQQSIVKKIVDEDVNTAFSEAYGKGYKSPWEKIEKAKPGIGKRIDAAAAALKQNADDYQKILDKENPSKKKTNEEIVNSSGGGGVRGFGNVSGNPDGSEIGSNYVNQNIADADTRDNIIKAQVKAHGGMHASTNNASAADQPNADTQDQIMNKAATKKVAKEDVDMSEMSKKFLNRFATKMISSHPDVTSSHPVGKDVKRKKALDLAMDKLVPKSAINKPKVVATEEKDPVKQLEDRLNKISDNNTSHNDIDKIMREVAKDYDMDVHDLHDKWVKKAGCTPDQYVKEDLRKWFSKTDPEGGWKRLNSKGEVIGPCAREPGEAKPKCMSNEKRKMLTKKERAAAVRAKRKHDPNAERKGSPINVSNFGKGKISEDKGWFEKTAKQYSKKLGISMDRGKKIAGSIMQKMKEDKEQTTEAKNWAQQAAIAIAMQKAKKKPKNEEVEHLEEKNTPTNPTLWSRAKALARSKFDVYPSAYANGWAAKWYKSKGGGWKSTNEEVEVIDEISDTTIGKVNKIRSLYGPKSKTPTAVATLARAVERVRNKSNVGKKP